MLTTIEDMRKLKKGDTFIVNGEQHTAASDAKLVLSGMKEPSTGPYENFYKVYDENGDVWYEDEFPIE